jgi:folB: dihydroneopterin aldolase
MDQIRLTGIRATGKHGVLDFEHERAQTFVVDATLFLDLAAAGRSDDLNDTVDYGAIAKGIVAIIEGEHVDLIEKLANRIVGMILGFPAVCRTQVTVHKPNAPITVPFDDVSVTVERSRETVDSPSRERSSEHGQVHHAIIAMGGNQGDVTATLRDAVRCIDGLPSTQVTGCRRSIGPTHGACRKVLRNSAMRSCPWIPGFRLLNCWPVCSASKPHMVACAPTIGRRARSIWTSSTLTGRKAPTPT